MEGHVRPAVPLHTRNPCLYSDNDREKQLPWEGPIYLNVVIRDDLICKTFVDIATKLPQVKESMVDVVLSPCRSMLQISLALTRGSINRHSKQGWRGRMYSL